MNIDAQLIKFIEKNLIGKTFEVKPANDGKHHKIVAYKFVEDEKSQESVRLQSDWRTFPDIPKDKFEKIFNTNFTPVDPEDVVARSVDADRSDSDSSDSAEAIEFEYSGEISTRNADDQKMAVSDDSREFFSLVKSQLSAQGDEFKELRNSLLESINKVKEDKSFVPQAKAITEIADTMIKMRQTEINALQTLGDLIGR